MSTIYTGCTTQIALPGYSGSWMIADMSERRTSAWWIGGIMALVVGVLVAATVWFLRDDDDPEALVATDAVITGTDSALRAAEGAADGAAGLADEPVQGTVAWADDAGEAAVATAPPAGQYGDDVAGWTARGWGGAADEGAGAAAGVGPYADEGADAARWFGKGA